ncbi:hypothetical protein DSO57_1017116 [Entomophthora muscae]|uniref:Uncharacterized protein n=1 Tax=Entomophthora muscae TaxID=34485 RepID=A0ACC2UEG0_9FUNG|nr:hypothetical protein DSO57_1017116 [Entomophthora muscae]
MSAGHHFPSRLNTSSLLFDHTIDRFPLLKDTMTLNPAKLAGQAHGVEHINQKLLQQSLEHL